jgi:glycosyltransferase involved in cell wall biosynthesis
LNLKIAIVWEQVDAGGVDSVIACLLNHWNSSDTIDLFYNKQNNGVRRLQSLLKNNKIVSFKKVFTPFFNIKENGFSIVIKLTLHVIAPFLFLFNIILYYVRFNKAKYDVVLGQNGGFPGSYAVSAAMIAAKVVKINTRCMVIHHAAIKPIFLHYNFRVLVESLLAKTLTSLIAVSEQTKETILRNTRICDSQDVHVRVIDNPVLFASPLQRNVPFNSEIRIVIVGRVEKYKGHDDLICAISLVNMSKYKIKLDIIGSYSAPECERLTILSQKLNIEESVCFKGYQKRNIAEILAQYDVLVCATNTFEGFGLTLIEALSSNIRVVTSLVGIASAVKNHPKVKIYPSGDIDALKDSLESVSAEIHRKVEYKNNYDLSKYNPTTISQIYRNHLLFDYYKNL